MGASRNVTDVLEENSERLMAVPGVHGVAAGQADGEPCILVLADADPLPGLPETIEGFEVHVRVTGPIRALDYPDQ